MVAKREVTGPFSVRGEHFVEASGGRLRCEICPRFCTLSDGQRGFCFVREARAGAIHLTSYGKASGFCIDPIEKKPLNHFFPGTSVLSFGTAGCNLGCKFCQNWDISKSREMDRLTDEARPDRIAEAAREAGCASVAFTYNDPVIFAEYAIDTAAECHERGLKTVAVTAGYITANARKDFYRHIDAANVDLKGFTEAFYKQVCYAELAPVLDTLEWLKKDTNVWVEVTTLLIPGKNDGEDELKRMTEWFARTLGPETPLHFTAFHPDFKMTDISATPFETLRKARDIAKNAGIFHVYTGNVHDADGQSTRCGACGHVLIERNWYELGPFRLKEDATCPQCSTRLAGHFSPKPGNWGARRRRLHVAQV